MWPKYEIASDPITEPISLAEARLWLKLDSDNTLEDSAVSDLISAVREKFEDETGRALAVRDITAYWDRWPTDSVFALPMYPVIGVSEIGYKDTDGATQTWATSNYTVDTVGITPRIWIAPDGEQPDTGAYPNAVWVTYVIGTEEIPLSAKQSLELNMAMLYERREDMKINDNEPHVRSAAWLAFNHRKRLI